MSIHAAEVKLSLRRLLAGMIVLLCSGGSVLLRAESVAVLHQEGTLRGFLELLDSDGKRIANGALIQTVKDDVVRSELVFHFRDGSLDDESSVFTQRGTFHLLRDHHVQKGPSFPHALDVDIDTASGQVKTIADKDGKAEEETTSPEMPEDLANGLPLVLAKNIHEGTAIKVAYLASTPKPRLVHLAISAGEDGHFVVGGVRYKAGCFVYHVELGGVAGVVAPLVGKQPKDSRVWVLGGIAPAFVRAELPFYEGGPMWTIQMVAPKWER